jgi:periplasmic divalent cation tolerance protein
MNTDFLVVLCTCPNAGTAQAISTALLEQKLAACVNRVSGVRSMYRWAGKIEHDDEVMLVIKSATEHFARLETTIRSLHPADVPEIIGLPIVAGSGDYLDWLGESLS